MLKAYKEKYYKNNFQYILVDSLGKIIDTDDSIIPSESKYSIQEVHPFFESISDLFTISNQHYDFSCVNLDFEKKSIIADIVIYTHDNNENIIIIENLTEHYNRYQLTAQTRNESVINSQILELKNEYLLEKEQFKNNFIANFSHQLRNPITASAIFSKFLSNTNLNSEQKNYLDIILSANNDLKYRINDILDLAKIESGQLILNETTFNLKELLNKIATGYQIFATKQNLDFETGFDPKLPSYLVGDRYRLKQIIGNLINNAINFTSKGQVSLHVSLNYIRAEKASLHIEVADTGIGIDKSEHDSIFERFTKVNPNSQNNRNIGLGLAIVKYLLAQMNGNISIESQSNLGSKFVCNLSLKTAKESHKLLEVSHEIVYPDFDKKKSILLVEDSELIQLSILKILSSNGNFFLNIISNGEDVIPTLKNQEADIILISNTIQRYSAEELARSIKELSTAHKKIPILALSTEVFKEDLKRYKRSGIKDVISKPFDDKSLLDKLYKYVK